MPMKLGVKYTLGKESGATPGTAVNRTIALSIRDIGSLDREINKIEDPVIAGQGMSAGEFAASADVKGSIPLSPRAGPGFGSILKGVFGTEATPVQVIGAIAMRYIGASASCKVVTDVSAKTITCSKGVLGAETADTDFGTAGVLTLTSASVDTMTELVAVINGYTAKYEAVLLTGDGAATITSVMTVTAAQGKGKWVYLFLTGTSGAYVHPFTLDLTAGSELPTWSIQRDGFQDNYLYDGCVVNTLSMSGALKGAVEAECEILGMKETIGQSASTVVLSGAKPLIFGGGKTSINGTTYNFTRKFSLKIDRGGNADGYGQSTLDRAYHQKGVAKVEASASLRLDAVSILERPKVEAGLAAPFQVVMIGSEAKKVGTSSVAEMLIVSMAASEVSSFKDAANGDQIDVDIGFKAYNPAGTYDYDAPVSAWLITADSAAY